MSYQALYRVWRPRTFADVVGQSHITTTLQNAISQQKFSHAYLFSGPRGTGKTSAAKIFAQTINCEQMPTREPCNECSSCLGILDGTISDVIEIDAASNTSVDDIREIRDKVKYAPTSVPYKVYIIDEVHMISINAFNALLKTLEEPPAHVVFILATTEPHKIPLTIISRCQRFDFRAIHNKAIFSRMKEIVEHENLSVSDDALESIALVASGGMRDALSILDQAISYSDGQVGLEEVLAVTGGVSQSILTDITKAMYEQDTKKTLQMFDSIMQHGKEPSRFVFDFIYFLRDILFYKTTPELEGYLERAVVNEGFSQLTEMVDRTWVQDAIQQLTQCEQQMKWTNSPKIFAEVTILMITNRQHEIEEQVISPTIVTQLNDKLAELEKKIAQLEQSKDNQKERVALRRPERQQTSNKAYVVPVERIRLTLDHAEKSVLQSVRSNWADFLERLKAISVPAYAIAQDSKPVAASKDGLIVTLRFDIHCSIMMEHKEIIESALNNGGTTEYTIFPIPENVWEKIRAEYVKQMEKEPKEEKDMRIVEVAKDLVGESLLEIHDE